MIIYDIVLYICNVILFINLKNLFKMNLIDDYNTELFDILFSNTIGIIILSNN
jgi:hypothetical protein